MEALDIFLFTQTVPFEGDSVGLDRIIVALEQTLLSLAETYSLPGGMLLLKVEKSINIYDSKPLLLTISAEASLFSPVVHLSIIGQGGGKLAIHYSGFPLF